MLLKTGEIIPKAYGNVFSITVGRIMEKEVEHWH